MYLAPTCVAKITYNTSRNGDRVLIVVGQVIGDATFARVHQTTTKRLLINLFTGRSFYERWPSKEDMPLSTNDDVFVGHGGDICAACNGNTMHDSDLRDAKRRHLGLQGLAMPYNRMAAITENIPCYRICAQSAPCQEIPT
jgi:hypothetical protein